MKHILIIMLLFAGVTQSIAKPKKADFFEAVQSGDIQSVTRMLQTGTKINSTNAEGRTALHIAVINRNTDILNLLFENNPDVNIQDGMIGATPLAVAASIGFVEGVKIILAHKPDLKMGYSGMPLPFVAVASDKTEIMTLLWNAGVDFKMIIDGYENANNVTCLMVATVNGNNNSIRFLLEKGIDVNTCDSLGDPAIIWALYYDKPDSAKLIIDSGKNVELNTNGSQGSAFFLAERKNYTELAKIIKSKGGH